MILRLKDTKYQGGVFVANDNMTHHSLTSFHEIQAWGTTLKLGLLKFSLSIHTSIIHTLIICFFDVENTKVQQWNQHTLKLHIKVITNLSGEI